MLLTKYLNTRDIPVSKYLKDFKVFPENLNDFTPVTCLAKQSNQSYLSGVIIRKP